MPPFTDDFWRALADYTLLYPTKASLGEGNPPYIWFEEYQRVRRTAFASVLLTSSGTEGGNASGQRNFAQTVLADALHCIRFERDNTYELPPHLAQYASEKVSRARGKRGFLMTFKP